MNNKGELGFHGLYDWWINEFTEEERKYMREKYQPFFATLIGESSQDKSLSPLDQREMEYTSQHVFTFLDGLSSWFKKDKEILEKINKKMLEIATTAVDFEINRQRWQEDKYYQPWFSARFAFLHAIEEADKFTDTDILMWNAVGDNISPKSCLRLDGKEFKKGSAAFKKAYEAHWSKLRYGCRCGVIALL